MIVKFEKVTKIGDNKYRIKTNKGVMFYRGLIHDGIEGHDVDVLVEEQVDVSAGGKKLVIIDYKFDVPVEPQTGRGENKSKEDADKERKTQEKGQKEQQLQELKGAFLRDILVSPALAKAKGDKVKIAQKWATAHAKWLLK